MAVKMMLVVQTPRRTKKQHVGSCLKKPRDICHPRAQDTRKGQPDEGKVTQGWWKKPGGIKCRSRESFAVQKQQLSAWKNGGGRAGLWGSFPEPRPTPRRWLENGHRTHYQKQAPCRKRWASGHGARQILRVFSIASAAPFLVRRKTGGSSSCSHKTTCHKEFLLG